jgi:hypothetical protein
VKHSQIQVPEHLTFERAPGGMHLPWVTPLGTPLCGFVAGEGGVVNVSVEDDCCCSERVRKEYL